jgi:hypothetical protein
MFNKKLKLRVKELETELKTELTKNNLHLNKIDACIRNFSYRLKQRDFVFNYKDTDTAKAEDILKLEITEFTEGENLNIPYKDALSAVKIALNEKQVLIGFMHWINTTRTKDNLISVNDLYAYLNKL